MGISLIAFSSSIAMLFSVLFVSNNKTITIITLDNNEVVTMDTIRRTMFSKVPLPDTDLSINHAFVDFDYNLTLEQNVNNQILETYKEDNTYSIILRNLDKFIVYSGTLYQLSSSIIIPNEYGGALYGSFNGIFERITKINFINSTIRIPTKISISNGLNDLTLKYSIFTNIYEPVTSTNSVIATKTGDISNIGTVLLSLNNTYDDYAFKYTRDQIRAYLELSLLLNKSGSRSRSSLSGSDLIFMSPLYKSVQNDNISYTDKLIKMDIPFEIPDVLEPEQSTHVDDTDFDYDGIRNIVIGAVDYNIQTVNRNLTNLSRFSTDILQIAQSLPKTNIDPRGLAMQITSYVAANIDALETSAAYGDQLTEALNDRLDLAGSSDLTPVKESIDNLPQNLLGNYEPVGLPTFSSDIDTPDKHDIGSLLDNVNIPFLSVFERTKIDISDAACSMKFEIMGQEMEFSICEFETPLSVIGSLMFSLVTLTSVIFIIRA